jgi:hypothetical protein
MTSRTILRVEHLDDRSLPSTVTPPLIHPLKGVGSGDVTRSWTIVDAGSNFKLKGTANLAALGTVKVMGSVHGVGFTWHGHAEGSLTFSNTMGSVTVSLEGPDQPGFSPLPRYFHYQITRGTGSYSHLTDQGTMLLTINMGWFHSHGKFALAV